MKSANREIPFNIRLSLIFQRYLLSWDEGQRTGPQSQLLRHSDGAGERDGCLHRHHHAVHRRRAGAPANAHAVANRLLDRSGRLHCDERDLCDLRQRRGSILERPRFRHPGSRGEAGEEAQEEEREGRIGGEGMKAVPAFPRGALESAEFLNSRTH